MASMRHSNKDKAASLAPFGTSMVPSRQPFSCRRRLSWEAVPYHTTGFVADKPNHSKRSPQPNRHRHKPHYLSVVQGRLLCLVGLSGFGCAARDAYADHLGDAMPEGAERAPPLFGRRVGGPVPGYISSALPRDVLCVLQFQPLKFSSNTNPFTESLRHPILPCLS